MRYLLGIIVCLFLTNAIAQNKWEYGVNLHFNSGLVKPISSDTLTNKPGFGAGMFLERSFSNFGLQSNINYSQIRYENDFLNISHVSNNCDFILSLVKPLDQKKQTHLVVGGILGYNISYSESLLNGGSIKPVFNQFINDNIVDVGLHIGLGLDLSKGSRFTVSYNDFFLGEQLKGSIKGRIDYLQLGLQLRINDLSNNENKVDKQAAKNKAVRNAGMHIQDLNSEGSGILVFVIPTKDSKAIGILETRDPAKRDSIRRARIVAMRDTIYRYYNFGDFVITTDSLLNFPSKKLKILTEDGVIDYKVPESKKMYYAKIDELFLEDNSQLKWGIFVYDNNLNMLSEPFPYFTPYRQFDKNFEKSDELIIEFNQRLKSYFSYNKQGGL